MNKHCYRIIFNKTLGRMVVVSERSKSQGKSSEPSNAEHRSKHTIEQQANVPHQPSVLSTLKQLKYAVLFALGSLGFSSAIHANNQINTQIIADKTAPKIEQPVIIATASGLTQVNIQTPSQAGVSKNQYSQFDVGQQGAILNNSRTHVKTQLAGFVEANPYLARGEAKVILNQVNSNNPSQLKGYVEVAGKRAEVVIANPSGIQVDGGGFINAQSTVLTTGQIGVNAQGHISYDNIANEQGQQGKIQIDGKGLNNSEADYTKLISQYNQLNAQVFAGQGDLEVQTGTQLDVSKLGGMYAGKIRLVGTEKGFGVNNQGVIASVGNGIEHGLVLDSKGNLSNTGSISAKKQVQINTTAIENTGTISSEQANIAITTNHLSNQGTIHSTQTNRINTDDTMNNQGEIYGGVLEVTTNKISNTGKLIQTGSGKLDITTETLTNQDKAVIGQNLYTSTKVDKVNTPSTAQAGGGVSTNQNSTPTNTNTNNHTPAPTTGIMTTPTHNGFITANKTLQNTGDTALITANGSIEVTSNKTINQNQASIDVEKLNTNHLNNIDSKIALDSVNWQLEQFDNTQGSLSAKTQISIDSQSNIINQQGKLISGGDIRLNAQNNLDNNQGTIQAKENTQLQGVNLDNKEGTITGKQTTLQINNVFDNKDGQVFANDNLTITNSSDKNLIATTVIDNTQGKLLSENLINVKAKTLYNQGEIASPTVQINTIDDLTHDNKGTLIANQLSLTSQGSIHNKDRLVAGNQLSLNANHLHNSENATINAQIAEINITSNLTNQGLIHADNLTISAETLQNLGAKIYGTDVNINANTLINQGANKGAIIASQNSLDIGVNKLINQHGNTIHSNATDNAWLLSLGSLNIHGKDGKKTADSITNLGARIESGTDMQLLADKISNRNANFSSEVKPIENSERQKEYITPERSSQKIDVNVLEWRPWSRAGYYTYKSANALEVNLNHLGKAPITSLYTCQNEENCGLNYDIDSVVWQYFKITPPDTPMPVIHVDIPEPTLPTGESEESCKKNNPSSACVAYHEKLKAYDKAVQPFKAWEEANLQKLEALEKAINEYNAQFGHPQFKNYTHIKVKEHEEQSVVITSAPAQIISGQKLAITANQVVNDKSHILASDKITVDSNNLDNINAEGVHRTIQEGTSQWTNSRWRGGFKRYHQRDWGAELPFKDIQETTITLPVTQYKEQMTPAELNQYKNNQIVINNANNTIGTASQINVPTNTVTGQSLVLPNSALYTINANNSNQPVIQTDPAFTNGKIWLGSDFMTDKLGHQADHIHKRLGDGYYEQQLIKDQIMALTGRRYLADYRNDDEQYRTLMDNAVTIAKPLNLRVGVALTAEQIAGLTTDIVWLVEQEVTLKDKNGQDYQQKVLVPKVYVRSKIADLTGTGNLISAQNVDVKLSGSLNNEGHIIAHQGLNIQADNINNQNTGTIKGDFVQLNARENINNIGGTIGADSAMHLTAGKDIKNIATTSQTQSQLGQSHSERTSIDRIAKIYVGNKNQDSNLTTLSINANGQYVAQAGQIDNAGGSSVINVKQGIELGATKTGYNINAIGDSNNYYKISEYQDVGSTITGKGNIVAVTQNDINATATTISSETGKVALIANGENSSINIKEGRHTESLDTAYLMKNKSLTSSKTTKGSYSHQTDQTISSQIDGKQVIISATQDVNLTAVQAISDEQTMIQAGRNVNISSAQNHSEEHYQHETKKSGLMGSGGIGFSIGSERNKQDNTQRTTTQVGSTIGSLQGDTTLVAGEKAQVIASSLSSPQGNITVQGQQIDIRSANNSYHHINQTEYEKKGLTVAVNVPLVEAIQNTINTAKQIGQSKNDRVNAMATANTAFQGYQTAQQLQKAGKSISDLAKNGNLAQSAKDANISVSITYGEQKNTTKNETQGTTASASQVMAGGTVHLNATGAGEKSNLNISGSDVLGQQGTHLSADNNINIVASEQNHRENSTNRSQGWNAGVAVSYGSNGLAFGVTAGGNYGKGYGNGSETTHRNSHIGDLNSETTIKSGNHLEIKGGQVKGNKVSIDAQSMNLTSLQDTATYEGKQMNVSGQATVGYGASVSADFSQSKMNADYASVTEQTGVFAGDDGFNINIKNNTNINGAVITSTAKAEQEGKNRLQTGTLTVSDIDNHSHYDGKSMGIGGSAGINGVGITGIGIGQDGDSQSSTTKGGIYTSNVIITNKAEQEQLAKAQGQTLEQSISNAKIDISTDDFSQQGAKANGALNNNFDKDKVQKELDVQREVTQSFDENRREFKQQQQEKAEQARLESDVEQAEQIEQNAKLINLGLDLVSLDVSQLGHLPKDVQVAYAVDGTKQVVDNLKDYLNNSDNLILYGTGDGAVNWSNYDLEYTPNTKKALNNTADFTVAFGRGVCAGVTFGVCDLEKLTGNGSINTASPYYKAGSIIGENYDPKNTSKNLAKNVLNMAKPKDNAKKLVAGSPEHKQARWEEYQNNPNSSKWDYQRWSNTYDANMTKATQANKARDNYHRNLGWGTTEETVTVEVKGKEYKRRLDIADVSKTKAIEHKTGYQSRTEDVLWELERDKALVKSGWNIEWVFEGQASKPLIEDLKKAGIKVKFKK